jgi:hypothetical protein
MRIGEQLSVVGKEALVDEVVRLDPRQCVGKAALGKARDDVRIGNQPTAAGFPARKLDRRSLRQLAIGTVEPPMIGP